MSNRPHPGITMTDKMLKRIAELEADLKDYATAIGQNEQLRKENERLTAVVEAAKTMDKTQIAVALAAVEEDSDG